VRKPFVVLCVMMMALCAILSGCGKKKDEGGSNAENATVNLAESQYTGEWMAVKAEFKGEEQDVNEVVEGGLYLKLNADGTASLTGDGDESTGTWSESAEGVVFKADKSNLKFKNQDGQLVYELFGVYIYLVKQ